MSYWWVVATDVALIGLNAAILVWAHGGWPQVAAIGFIMGLLTGATINEMVTRQTRHWMDDIKGRQ